MELNDFIRSYVHSMEPYKPGLREEQVREIARTDVLVKVSSNESPSAPFESARKAGTQALTGVNRYPDGNSTLLKAALEKHLGVETENLVIGNGSNELLILLAYATVGAGDEVVYGWPSFIVYPLMCQLTGATARPVALNDREQFDLDAIREAITPATRLVVLCNPNNPTATYYSIDDFRAFMEAVPPHVLVVVDEAYREFVTDANCPDALEWFDPMGTLSVVRTFSKAYGMAGMRCGYAIMPRPLVLALDKIRAPFNVNGVAQAMATASLADTEELSRRILANTQQRARLQETFDRLEIAYAPSQTNFVWIHTPRPQECFTALLAKGVIVRDFGQVPALRVGVGSQDETSRIIEVFDELADKGFFDR